MSTQVQLPDGSRVTVQTDDPKAAAAAARKHWATKQAPAQPKPAKRTWVDDATDAVSNFADNVVPNWADEVWGVGYKGGQMLRNLVDGTPDDSSFAEGQRNFKQRQAEFAKSNPIAKKSSTAAGFVGGLLLPAGKVSKGANLVNRMAHGAAVGGAYGAVSGAGEGETLDERTDNAGRSAAIGATIGSLATPVLNGLSKAGSLAARYVPGVDAAARRLSRIPKAVLARAGIGTGPSVPGDRARQHGDRMLAGAMREGSIRTGYGTTGPAASPETIAAEVARRNRLGVPAMPADTTEALRNVAGWAGRGVGPGQRRVQEALASRQAAAANRVRQHITDELGDAVDPIRQVEMISASAKSRAAPLYEQAYRQPMVITPEIGGIMQTPAFRDAVPHAVRNIRNAQRDPEGLGFRFMPMARNAASSLPPNLPHVMTPEGVIVLDRNLSTEGFDQVIRAMRDNADRVAERDALTGRVRHNTDSVHINARASDLAHALKAQNPAYRDATAGYADAMAQREAMIRGQDMAKLTGTELAAQARQIPDHAQEAWAIGARSALANDASEFGARYPMGNAAANTRRALGDESKQAVIGNLTGNTGAVRNLGDRLEAEEQAYGTWQEVYGNSRTAARQETDRDMDRALKVSTSGAFTPRGVIQGAVDYLVGHGLPKFRNEVKARIAQIVTETNPATVRELMDQVAAQAERDASFADLLHRSGVIGAKAAGASVQPAENAPEVPYDLSGGEYQEDDDAVARAVAEVIAEDGR